MTPARLRVLIVAGVALLAAVDFGTRIYVPRQHEARDAESFVPAVVPAAPPAESIARQLAGWLPRLRPVAGGTEATAEAEWTLSLLAVFDDRSSVFAVLRADPAGGGQGKTERVVEGDQVHGYKVVRIEPAAIVLEGPQGPRELRLFAPDEQALAAVGPATPSPTSRAKPATTPVGGAAPPAPAGTPAAPVSASRPQPASPRPATPGPVASGSSTTPPKAAAKPASSPGPRKIQAQELKPGQAFELPESMRGLKLVEPEVPAQNKAQAPTPAPAGRPEPPPQKP